MTSLAAGSPIVTARDPINGTAGVRRLQRFQGSLYTRPASWTSPDCRYCHSFGEQPRIPVFVHLPQSHYSG